MVHGWSQWGKHIRFRLTEYIEVVVVTLRDLFQGLSPQLIVIVLQDYLQL
jgi:hypothetical protein